jgi:hypothetical protein
MLDFFRREEAQESQKEIRNFFTAETPRLSHSLTHPSTRPGPAKNTCGHPNECDHNADKGRVQVADLMEVIELIEVAAFECGDENFCDPSTKEYEGNASWDEPAGEEQEAKLFSHIYN